MPFVKGAFCKQGVDKHLSKSKVIRAAVDGAYTRGNKKKKGDTLALKDREAFGLMPVTQAQRRCYFALCYIFRYDEPAEEEWDSCIKELSDETCADQRTIRNIWETLVDTGDVEAATTDAFCSGRPHKMTADNPGLVAAAAALNMGVSPKQATYLCNVTNKRKMDVPIAICWNTLMATLRRLTKVQMCRVLYQKTRSKDSESAWAIARLQRKPNDYGNDSTWKRFGGRQCNMVTVERYRCPTIVLGWDRFL